MSTVSDATSTLYSLLNAYSSTSSSSETETTTDDSDETLSVSESISLSYSLSESLLSLISGSDADNSSSDFSGLYAAIEMTQNETEINDGLITYYTDLLSDDSDEISS